MDYKHMLTLQHKISNIYLDINLIDKTKTMNEELISTIGHALGHGYNKYYCELIDVLKLNEKKIQRKLKHRLNKINKLNMLIYSF